MVRAWKEGGCMVCEPMQGGGGGERREGQGSTLAGGLDSLSPRRRICTGGILLAVLGSVFLPAVSGSSAPGGLQMRTTAGRGGMGMAALRLRGGSSWGAGASQVGGGGTWGSPNAAQAKKAYNPEQDAEADFPPDDAVSALAFSPEALQPKTYLVAASWDSTVRCWEVDVSSGKTTPVGMQRHEKPAMCCGWRGDGGAIYSGSADGKGMVWEIGTGQWRQIAQHDGPIVGIFYSDLPSPCVITGSHDKTVKFWDAVNPGSGQPLGVLQMPDRVFAMDVKGSVLVVATAERHVLVYDLRNLAQPFRQKFSPLKYQTRCVSIFPDQTGFCIGSVEGRVAIEHIQDADLVKNFAFKCHRQNADSKQPEVYAVNSIAFHRVGTFATAGGDGTFNFWDKDAKHRLKAFARADQSVSASVFCAGGELYAYAVNYDWQQGVEGLLKLPPEGRGSHIMLHQVKQECAPKNSETKK